MQKKRSINWRQGVGMEIISAVMILSAVFLCLAIFEFSIYSRRNAKMQMVTDVVADGAALAGREEPPFDLSLANAKAEELLAANDEAGLWSISRTYMEISETTYPGYRVNVFCLELRDPELRITKTAKVAIIPDMSYGVGTEDEGGGAVNYIGAAIEMAANDFIGYNSTPTWNMRNPDVDAGTFISLIMQRDVHNIFAADEYGQPGDGTLGELLESKGFRKEPFMSVEDLSPGDILINSNSAELYLGSNKIIGAHSHQGHPEPGDQNKHEVSMEDIGTGAAWMGGFVYRGHVSSSHTVGNWILPDEYANLAPTDQGGYVSSEYGPRWGTMHKGIDLSIPAGTPVYAFDNGTVAATYASAVPNSGHLGSEEGSGWGNYVFINHGDFSTRYAHLNMVLVEPGDIVSVGDIIGYSGHTGDSSGPHLHFEYYDYGAIDELDTTNPRPILEDAISGQGGSHGLSPEMLRERLGRTEVPTMEELLDTFRRKSINEECAKFIIGWCAMRSYYNVPQGEGYDDAYYLDYLNACVAIRNYTDGHTIVTDLYRTLSMTDRSRSLPPMSEIIRGYQNASDMTKKIVLLALKYQNRDAAVCYVNVNPPNTVREILARGKDHDGHTIYITTRPRRNP